MRVLVFATARISNVTVAIDNGPRVPCHSAAARPADTPEHAHLYVCPWRPDQLDVGRHVVSAEVACDDGSLGSHAHPFTLDGRRLAGPLLAAVLLLSDLQALVRILFAVLYFLTLLAMLSPYLSRVAARRGLPAIIAAIQGTVSRIKVCDSLAHRLLLGYTLYLVAGPWFVGAMASDSWGAFTVHGVLMAGRLFPTPFGWVQGTLQLVFGVWPLLLVLGRESSRPSWVWRSLLWLYAGVAALQQLHAWREDWLTYGRAAGLLSPARLGFILLAALCLFRQTRR